MSSVSREKCTSAKLVRICWHRKTKSHTSASEIKGFFSLRTLAICQVHLQVNVNFCDITEAQVSQALKREEYNSACATVATSAAECKTRQVIWVWRRQLQRGWMLAWESHKARVKEKDRGGRGGVFEAAYKLATVQSRHATLCLDKTAATVVFLYP